jgi:hypothetical protein
MSEEYVPRPQSRVDTDRLKLLRSVTVSVRLDPKLRYFAELAARKQRRTLSSYIEWIIEESLERNGLNSYGGPMLAEEASSLWDVDEADRFVKLAVRHPDLLTHDEQVRWKLICENGAVWHGKYAGIDREWTWSVSIDNVNYQALRNHWDVFCKAARFELEREHLPKWKMFDPEGDSIPF